MFEYWVCENTLPEAYHKALVGLFTFGPELPCPDWGQKQKELSMTMVVTHPLEEPMISRCFPGYPEALEQYCQEILDGILDFEIERGNWEYTYHDRMVDQIPFIIQELRRNRDSRRAVIDIRLPEDMWSKEPACLQNLQYFIREGKLDCQVLFRSNDAPKAAFMNAFALIMLQRRIAATLSVPIGTYTHRANSFHCYEKDYETLKGYIKRIDEYSDVSYPYPSVHPDRPVKSLTYNYIGDWDEQMRDARPSIAEKVQRQKDKL